MTNIEQKFCDAIEILVHKAVDNAPYDRVVNGQIIECINAVEGVYRVKHQDAIFEAVDNNRKDVYLVGTNVYVSIPNGDTSMQKFILGAAIDTSRDNKASIYQDAYIPAGESTAVLNEEIGLISFQNNKIVLYDKTNSNDNKVEINNNMLREKVNANENKYLQFKASFRTALSSAQQQKGNYGVRLYVKCSENDANFTKTILFDTNSMEGTPYNFTQASPQSKIYSFKDIRFEEVEKIEFFCTNFQSNLLIATPDIFISNFSLTPVQKLDDSSANSYNLIVATPLGTTITENQKVVAQASLYAGNLKITSKANPINYYWFIEDCRIKTTSNYYSELGGEGWRCLNTKTSTGFAPGPDTLEIGLDLVTASAAIIKCVATYKDNTFSKEILFTNSTNTIKVVVESDQGQEFYFDTVSPDLTCKVYDSDSIVDNPNYLYQWVLVSEETGSTEFPLDKAQNLKYNNEYRELKNNYEKAKSNLESENTVKTLEEKQKEVDKAYAKLVKYETMYLDSSNQLQMPIARVDGPHIYKLNISEYNSSCILKCFVFEDKGDGVIDEDDTYVGFGQIELRNNTNSSDNYSLAIVNGNQTYMYDEFGFSPTSENRENKIKIEPLSFKIFNSFGKEIPLDLITDYSVQWYLPVKEKSLLIADSENTTGNNLDYALEDIFDPLKTDNTIKLVVVYKGQKLTAQTNFMIYKDGSQTVGGSTIFYRIVPNTDEPFVDYPTIYTIHNVDITRIPSHWTKIREDNTTSSYLNFKVSNPNLDWFKLQIYNNGLKVFDTAYTSGFQMRWGILKNIGSYSDLEVKKSGYEHYAFDYNGFSLTNTSLADNLTNIISCEFMYEKIKYKATLPLLSIYIKDSAYDIRYLRGTGFTSVEYSEAGESPLCEIAYPFAFEIKKWIGNESFDVGNDNSQNRVEVRWKNASQKSAFRIDTHREDWSLNKNAVYGLVHGSRIRFLPPPEYDGYDTSSGIIFSFETNNGSEIGKCHFPIRMYLDKNANIRCPSWYGNFVTIDADIDENTTEVDIKKSLSTLQFGRGQFKDFDSAMFTGIGFGQYHQTGSEFNGENGLYCFKDGVPVIQMGESGNTIFGNSDIGTLSIKPNVKNLSLYTPNFFSSVTSFGFDSYRLEYSGQDINKPGMIVDAGNGRVFSRSGGFLLDSKEGFRLFANLNKTNVSGEINEMGMLISNEGIFVDSDIRLKPGIALADGSEIPGEKFLGNVEIETSTITKSDIKKSTLSDNEIKGGTINNSVGIILSSYGYSIPLKYFHYKEILDAEGNTCYAVCVDLQKFLEEN